MCYRRHGHNNLDDPRITQPATYKLIDEHPPALKLYTDKLLALGVVTIKELDNEVADIDAENEKDYNESKQYTPDPAEWLASNWQVVNSYVVEFIVVTFSPLG